MTSMQTTTFDAQLARIESGERLTPDEIRQLAASPDILPIGMLSDAFKRRARGTTVTYLRTAYVATDAIEAASIPAAAREVVLTGTPASSAHALEGIRAARAIVSAPAPECTLAAFSWRDVERLAESEAAIPAVLTAWREAGLDALGEIALDALDDPESTIASLRQAGFLQIRLGVEGSDTGVTVDRWLQLAEIQTRHGGIQAISPLPSHLRAFRPTTGYADVKTIALARLAVPNVPSIQVDWRRYGPKLAQVALTFGADDVVGISPLDDAQEGRRRTPLEEIRRNVEAAGFQAVERDGRFTPRT